MSLPTPTVHLPLTKLFEFAGAETSEKDRIECAHKRAKAIALSYAPTIQDIVNCSRKYWDMHIDLICSFDGAAVALWTIQYNLVLGTLAPFLPTRPDLQAIVDDILNFRVTAHYMLTELGHGVDAPNIETRATLLPDGQIDLHTPHDRAAKHMPASLPAGGLPRVAIVFARLYVEDQDRGIRPFLVPLNDGHEMCAGVICRPLPNRCGSKPIGHSITHFVHVKLPHASLLGMIDTPADQRLHFLSAIWRIGIGSITLTAVIIPGLKMAAYIVAKFSQRRMITDTRGRSIPLITFRTQHAPVFHALAQSAVLEALFKSLQPYFANVDTQRTEGNRLEIRNGLSTVFKVLAVRLWRDTNQILIDRCGAQGLFEHNQLIPSEMEVRGVTVAEGDMLVLSIRLTSELLLGRYELPSSTEEGSSFSLQERGILNELQTILFQLQAEHRSDQFSRRILPRSIAFTEAIGLRMAHEAAKHQKVDPLLIELFEIGAIQKNLSWYIENSIIAKRQDVFDREDAILSQLQPRLDELLEGTGAAPYAFGAITSQATWDKFYHNLPVLKGNASVDIFGSSRTARL